jgi:hypothetical protein
MGLKDVDSLGQLAGVPGAQRSLRRMRQFLSWAFAPSPGNPGRVWARLAPFCESGLFRPLYGVRMCLPAPWPTLSARVISRALA